MTPFEKRLLAVEAKQPDQRAHYGAVIFDGDRAKMLINHGAYAAVYEAAENEPPDTFEARMLQEVHKFAREVVTMTLAEYEEIVARLEDEI